MLLMSGLPAAGDALPQLPVLASVGDRETYWGVCGPLQAALRAWGVLDLRLFTGDYKHSREDECSSAG